MGNQTSSINGKSGISITLSDNKTNELNWIPSFNVFSSNDIDTKIEESNQLKEYIDLRNQIAQIEELDDNCYQVVKIVASAINYELLKSSSLETFQPSFLYLYKLLDKYAQLPCRHSIFDIQNIISKFGICTKNDYNDINMELNETIVKIAHPYRHIKFRKVENDNRLIKQKLKNGQVVIIGLPVNGIFYKTGSNPNLQNPNNDDKKIVGGFCGLIVGFIENESKFIVMTARGKKWGQDGFIYISYDIVANNGAELYFVDLKADLIKMELEDMVLVNNQTAKQTLTEYSTPCSTLSGYSTI